MSLILRHEATLPSQVKTDLNTSSLSSPGPMSSSGAQSSLFGDDSIPSSPSEVDSEPSFELDGHDDDPIAICGFSLKFPDDATSPDGFWEMLLEKRCASREFPSNRMNADGFYQPTPRLNTVSIPSMNVK
jgi:hypothetical protein